MAVYRSDQAQLTFAAEAAQGGDPELMQGASGSSSTTLSAAAAAGARRGGALQPLCLPRRGDPEGLHGADGAREQAPRGPAGVPRLCALRRADRRLELVAEAAVELGVGARGGALELPHERRRRLGVQPRALQRQPRRCHGVGGAAPV